ncbi:hypothetical protein M231_07170 [Tremella mesenterica]|uniref:Folylpolyglutamate synthase n=1 Tax=Tremella mesenterica TaxID=5217 RepID=A0A4Q1BCW7_TREME|nr:hypothetical protein M231_07170 [Tremella mesenterica]
MTNSDLASKAIDPDDLSHLSTQHALKEAYLSLIPTYDPTHIHVVSSIEHAVHLIRSSKPTPIHHLSIPSDANNENLNGVNGHNSGGNGNGIHNTSADEEGRKSEEPNVLVTGSLHLVGGVMEVAELQEFLSMN